MSACAAYENDLARLLGDDDVAPEERPGLCERLRRHALDCPSCGATLDLVEMLALPAHHRDDDPRAEYWEDFNSRVRRRIDAEVQRDTRPAPWLWVTGAVAATVVVAIALWWVVGGGFEGVTPLTATNGVDLPRELVETLAAASPAEVEAEVEALASWGAAEEADAAASGLFPEIDGLSDEERLALLQWLRSQES